MEKFRSWNYLVVACLILVLISGTLLAGCTEPAPTTPTPTPTPAPTPTPTSTPTITPAPPPEADIEAPWNIAWRLDGWMAEIIGPVAEVEDLGPGIAKILVKLGDVEEGFTAMIQYDYKDLFTDPAVEGYLEKQIAVTGKVYINTDNQRPEIAVTDPSQIVILGEAVWPVEEEPEEEAPEEEAPEGQVVVLTPQEAAAHEGETATVCGEVTYVEVSPFSGEELIHMEGFRITVAPEYFANFPDGFDIYVGQTVHVTGEISVHPFSGDGVITVTDPSEIKFGYPEVEPVVLTPQEAAAHEGEIATVCGEVISVEVSPFSGEELIRMEGFRITVAPEYFANFPDGFGDYVGQTVCVTGEISVHPFSGDGVITITDPSEITFGYPKEEPVVLTPQEAAAHEGEIATVCGEVISVEVSPFSGEELIRMEGFRITVAPEYFANFPDGFGDYVGRTVCVTGEISVHPFSGDGVITITDPSQITVSE